MEYPERGDTRVTREESQQGRTCTMPFNGFETVPSNGCEAPSSDPSCTASIVDGYSQQAAISPFESRGASNITSQFPRRIKMDSVITPLGL